MTSKKLPLENDQTELRKEIKSLHEMTTIAKTHRSFMVFLHDVWIPETLKTAHNTEITVQRIHWLRDKLEEL